MKKKIKYFFNKLETVVSMFCMKILQHRIVTSFSFAILLLDLYYFSIVHNVANVLPHIITFSTLMLAVISLVFTIIISIRDGELYEQLKNHLDKTIAELYKILKESIVFCILVVIYSIMLICIRINLVAFKYVLCFIGAYIFGMMVCLCLAVFLISISLLEEDGNGK